MSRAKGSRAPTPTEGASAANELADVYENISALLCVVATVAKALDDEEHTEILRTLLFAKESLDGQAGRLYALTNSLRSGAKDQLAVAP